MVKITGLLDYSIHELEVKRLLKEVHDLLLKKEFATAAAQADKAVVELRLLRTAIKSHVNE